MYQKQGSNVRTAIDQIEGFQEMYERARMKMEIAGFSKASFRNYMSPLAQIALFHKKSPVLLNIDEIEEFLFYSKNKKPQLSETFFKHTVYGLRFVFKIHGNEELILKMPKIRRPHKLPVVLSKEEMVRMINNAKQLKHRILIGILYGCGLRCMEARNIAIADLDFDRLTLHVKAGKGRKDRYVPISKPLADDIIQYIQIAAPKTWLFNGLRNYAYERTPHSKFGQRSIQWVVTKAAEYAGIKKKINVHTLRHTFATHLLEDGMDIVSIKELMGHALLSTTLGYLHIAQWTPKQKFSPFDNLVGIRIISAIQLKLPLPEPAV